MPSLDEIYATKPEPQIAAQGPLNLGDELLKQYARAKLMLQEAEEEPLNYRTQTLNAITSIIGQIVKLQSDLHTLEEVKKIEVALSTALKKFPDLQQEFLGEYKGALNL